ncbi:MAG: hypothetical protein CME07_04840 [Gemmatimonadetes bacterium]|nr:hypothetical protein [Gemmatimonadota bacterium]
MILMGSTGVGEERLCVEVRERSRRLEYWMMRQARGLGIAACITLVATHASAAYVEDFATTDYMDASGTTLNWDTTVDRLELPAIPREVGMVAVSGEAHAVVSAGDHAFVAAGTAGFAVLDVRDPGTPATLATLPMPGDALALTHSGDRVYVACGSAGVAVVDVTDPSAPVRAFTLPTPGGAFGVVVHGGHAYVAAGDSGLVICDLSGGGIPAHVSTTPTPGYATDVALTGKYACVADGPSGVALIDVSNAFAPALLTSVSTPGSAMGVAPAGLLVYVADGPEGVSVVDISNPSAPFRAGGWSGIGDARAIVVDGNFACVAFGSGGVLLVDVTDPVNPAFGETVDTPGVAGMLSLAGEHAWVADGVGGVRVVRVRASRIEPVPVGFWRSYGTSRGVAVEGDLAFLAIEGWGMKILDISEPSRPRLIGELITPGSTLDVAVSGTLVAVADGPEGLSLVDVTDPSVPVTLSTHAVGGEAFDVALDGGRAWVAAGLGGTVLVDISDPFAPVTLGSVPTTSITSAVAVDGDLAVVANHWAGLQVIDATDPGNLDLVGTLDVPGDFQGVDIDGDLVCAAIGWKGVLVVDITDPTLPTVTGSVDPSGEIHDIVISGNRAYAAARYAGLQVIDITDPSSPFLSMNVPGDFDGLAFSGDLLLLADNYWPHTRERLRLWSVYSLEREETANTATSLSLPHRDMRVLWARLTTAESPAVEWELSPSGGETWQELPADGSWAWLWGTGDDIRWRCALREPVPGEAPSVDSLKIEWLYDPPILHSATDVPEDQGGWVDLAFTRSGHDFDNIPTPARQYYLWRRVEDPVLRDRVRRAEESSDESTLRGGGSRGIDGLDVQQLNGALYTISLRGRSGGFPPGTWAAVEALPAGRKESYTVTVRSPTDSTAQHSGESVYVVSVHTVDPAVWFVSSPVTGVSVDNLPPGRPTGLSFTAPTLAWVPPVDGDLDFCRVYASPTSELADAELIAETTQWIWEETGDPAGWYFVTAVDVAGNEGDPATVAGDGVTGVVTPGLPSEFALSPPVPNPFRVGATIRFALPRSVPVVLSVHDVAGRRVRILEDTALPAGRHARLWDGRDDSGRRVSQGVYFVRLFAGGFGATGKVVHRP